MRSSKPPPPPPGLAGWRGLGRSLCLLACLGLMAEVSWASDREWGCQNVPYCKCIWSSGRRTAECKKMNLEEIPSTLSKEIQHLDISGNPITLLPDNAFTNVELDNLQKLTLRDCHVRVVNAGAFNGLRIIIEIDLSNNRIHQLHRGTFNETERLRVLLLNHNRLQRLDDDLFYGLEFLQKVELSDNHLYQIGQRTFRQLPGLQTLTLDGNNLTKLSFHSFESLPKLGSLELRRNPWHCDCHLKPFRDWAIQRNLYTRPTSCAKPEALLGRNWDEIKSEEFACAPQIDLLDSSQHGDAGVGSAQLWCRATASPRPQISWVHRQRVLGNGTKRHASDRGYILQYSEDWANLTIPEVNMADKGEYVCIAKNFGGLAERSHTLVVLGEGPNRRESMVGLPLAIGLGIVAFLFLVMALTLCLCYCRRRRSNHDEKSAEAASLDHHGHSEQEKSLITAINPVVKPPRRYEAPSVTSHGTEMTELNKTLLDNDSVFDHYPTASFHPLTADGVGSVVGVLANGLSEEERGGRATPELESVIGRGNLSINLDGSISGRMGSPAGGMSPSAHHFTPIGAGGPGGGGGLVRPIGFAPLSQHGGSVLSGIGTLSRNTTPYRQYPPDLLAFSGGRNSSPTSQASTAPDNSRLPSQPQLGPLVYGSPSSPAASVLLGYSPGPGTSFKTLPHPPRSSSVTPYSYGHHPHVMPMSRHGGYGTIPRRPRAPSWSSCPPMSPTERDIAEPVYDNLGERKSANGCSVASLNRTPEPRMSMRNRPLPATPDTPSSTTSSSSARAMFTLPRAPRASPGPLQQLQQLQQQQLQQQKQPKQQQSPQLQAQQPLAARSTPEGEADWPTQLSEEIQKHQQEQPEAQIKQEQAAEAPSSQEEQQPPQETQEKEPAQSQQESEVEKQQSPQQANGLSPSVGSGTLTRKVPPRPPPKPKKRSGNGPLYEDEGEDGTEV